MRRFLLVTSALALAGAAACYEDEGTAPTSARPLTKVLLTDAPFPFDSVRAVELYIESIAASISADTAGGPGQEWVTVATPNRRFNLLELQNGTTTPLGAAELPVGQYRAVRMGIDTERSRIVGTDGNEAPVDWQSSAGRPTLYALVEQPMAVPASGSEIVIDFDVGRSFTQQSPGGPYAFSPWLRAVDKAATGAIIGAVTGTLRDGTIVPLQNATLTVLTGNAALAESTWSVAATGRTDAQGLYTVAYLLPGSYIVRADAPGARQIAAGDFRFFSSETRSAVSVAAGVSTPQSFSVAEIGAPGGSDDAVASVSISPTSATIPVGSSALFTATLRASDGRALTGRAIAWSTADSTVARPLTGGLVSAVSAGTTTITATSEGQMATATVVVR